MKKKTKAEELKQKNKAAEMKQETAAAKMKQKNKVKKKKDRFIRSRMWFWAIISSVFNDRGTIPPNIGNNILVTNNMYITKHSLSAIIMVGEFSDNTYVGFCSDLINTVKSKVHNVVVDVTIKSLPYWIDTSASGMTSRERTWELLNNPNATERHARRAARQLYTLEVARSGEQMYRSRVYITVRATEGGV